MLEKYPDKVKLVVKHFPLPMHRFARTASEAALAAGKQGKFWEFHHDLFKSYRNLNEKIVQDLAKKHGLDLGKFATDRKSPEIQGLVTRDMQEARKLGVRGTPTVFINGKMLKVRTPNVFDEIIQAEIEKNS